MAESSTQLGISDKSIESAALDAWKTVELKFNRVLAKVGDLQNYSKHLTEVGLQGAELQFKEKVFNKLYHSEAIE